MKGLNPTPAIRNQKPRTVMLPKQNVDKSVKKEEDIKIENTKAVESRPTEVSVRKSRNRQDFSLTNTGSSRRPSGRRRRPPRPGRRTLSNQPTSGTITKIETPPIPPAIPNVQGKYHFKKPSVVIERNITRKCSNKYIQLSWKTQRNLEKEKHRSPL
jgi:hypothetical protein